MEHQPLLITLLVAQTPFVRPSRALTPLPSHRLFPFSWWCSGASSAELEELSASLEAKERVAARLGNDLQAAQRALAEERSARTSDAAAAADRLAAATAAAHAADLRAASRVAPEEVSWMRSRLAALEAILSSEDAEALAGALAGSAGDDSAPAVNPLGPALVALRARNTCVVSPHRCLGPAVVRTLTPATGVGLSLRFLRRRITECDPSYAADASACVCPLGVSQEACGHSHGPPQKTGRETGGGGSRHLPRGAAAALTRNRCSA